MTASTPDNLTALLSALLDGSITPDAHATLAARLRTDPAARAAYHDAVELQSLLHWQHSARAAQPIAIPDTSTPTPHKPDAKRQRGVGISRSPRPTPFIIYPIAIASAAVFLAACGVAVYLLAFNADPSDIAPRPSDIEHPPVATLIHTSAGGNLTTPHDYPAEGSDYSAGEYTLSGGTAEFMLTNAVNVKLRGDTRLHMRNDMNVALSRGSADFVVPKDATGFTVHMPNGAKVVDLGTRFRVVIDDDGQRSVRVTEGSVRIETATTTRIVEAPMLAKLDGEGAVALSDPSRFDIDFTAEPSDKLPGDRKLPEGWVWDSPGQAAYEFAADGGLRVSMPADHDFWFDRGLAPILYHHEELPETFVAETAVRLVDGATVMGSLALYDVDAKRFVISIGMMHHRDKHQAALEVPAPVQHQQFVEADTDRLLLRLERTDGGHYIASYRLTNNDEWQSAGEIDASQLPGDPANYRLALLSKAWHTTPGTVEYEHVRLEESETESE